MGLFIGHIGAFCLLAAAVLLVGKFLYEAGIVKQRESVTYSVKICGYTVILGMAYYFLMAYMKNTMSGQINFFDSEKLFLFGGIDKVMEQIVDPSVSGSIKGWMMPLYTYLVHITGKVVFEQYLGTALFINFAGMATGMTCLAKLFCDDNDKEAELIFGMLAFPFAGLLFTPAGFGAAFGLAAIAAYMFYKKHMRSYGVFLILAVLTNKLGLIAVLPLIFEQRSWKNAIEYVFSKSPYIRAAVLFTELSLNAAGMFLMIGGKL